MLIHFLEKDVLKHTGNTSIAGLQIFYCKALKYNH